MRKEVLDQLIEYCEECGCELCLEIIKMINLTKELEEVKEQNDRKFGSGKK